jgi:uncharacterized protein (UPF0276 family)
VIGVEPAMPSVLHCGIGWRWPHYAELLERRPRLAFVEVHSENFFGDGGATLEILAQGRAAYPVSLHGVGLALGSAAGLDPWHLDRLATLVERVDPVRVSDHASFARATIIPGRPVVHGSDLLPLAFTAAALTILVDNVGRVQDRLKRSILVENLSAYLRWSDDSMSEPAFFNELARRSGCGMLLDLNNIVVNAMNAGVDPVATACAHVDALRPDIVGEIHLAGFRDLGDIVIDDHGSRVHAPVWEVFRHAVARLGPKPTLIEWDTDVPALDVLLAEASRAEAFLSTTAMPSGTALRAMAPMAAA